MQLKWDSSLDIQVPDMNDEHKVLIDMMNRLLERNEAKAAKSEIKKLLNDFVAYALKHFSDEEAYMAQIKFPGLEVHKLVHKRLVEKLTMYARDFDEKQERLPTEFFNFLHFWLVSHIKGIDIQYGHFSRGKAA